MSHEDNDLPRSTFTNPSGSTGEDILSIFNGIDVLINDDRYSNCADGHPSDDSWVTVHKPSRKNRSSWSSTTPAKPLRSVPVMRRVDSSSLPTREIPVACSTPVVSEQIGLPKFNFDSHSRHGTPPIVSKNDTRSNLHHGHGNPPTVHRDNTKSTRPKVSPRPKDAPPGPPVQPLQARPKYAAPRPPPRRSRVQPSYALAVSGAAGRTTMFKPIENFPTTEAPPSIGLLNNPAIKDGVAPQGEFNSSSPKAPAAKAGARDHSFSTTSPDCSFEESELWDYVGMTKEDFLALDPTAQSAKEYECKTDIRKCMALHEMKRAQHEGGIARQQALLVKRAEREILQCLRDLKDAKLFKIIDLLAEERVSICRYCSTGSLSCECRIDATIYYHRLIDELRLPSHNNAKRIPLSETQITEQLSNMAISEFDVITDALNLSLIAYQAIDSGPDLKEKALSKGCLGQDDMDHDRTSPRTDLHFTADFNASLNRAGEEMERRMELAKLILKPETDAAQRGHWFKAIGLAGLAYDSLDLRRHLTPKSHAIFMSSNNAIQHHLMALAGLALAWVKGNLEPDWDLLAQLVINGAKLSEAPLVKVYSLASTIAQALGDSKGSLSLLRLWAKSRPIPKIESELQNPIESLIVLANSFRPKHDWQPDPDGDEIIRAVCTLEETALLSNDLIHILLNYSDHASKRTQAPYYVSYGDPHMGKEGAARHLERELNRFSRAAEQRSQRNALYCSISQTKSHRDRQV